MILLDTHILLWWQSSSPRLAPSHRKLLQEHERDGIFVSAISFWEIAMLASKNRLQLTDTVSKWVDEVIHDPVLEVLPATPQILVESTLLPGDFHADPGDRIIVATARRHDLQLLTVDSKILAYQHVCAIAPQA